MHQLTSRHRLLVPSTLMPITSAMSSTETHANYRLGFLVRPESAVSKYMNSCSCAHHHCTCQFIASDPVAFFAVEMFMHIAIGLEMLIASELSCRLRLNGSCPSRADRPASPSQWMKLGTPLSRVPMLTPLHNCKSVARRPFHG